MTYQVILSPDFEKETKVLFKKDPVLYSRFKRTVNSIIENPECGKPLRNILKGLRRVHIGHFVLIYETDTANKTVTFLKFSPHDKAYKLDSFSFSSASFSFSSLTLQASEFKSKIH